MSRIGKLPVELKENIKTEIGEKKIIISGPKGRLEYSVPAGIKIEKISNSLIIKKTKNNEKTKKLYGLVRSLVYNMVYGVSEGFAKELEIKGVGYRAKVEGNDLILNLGFSHPVRMTSPEGVEIKVQKNIIVVSGVDKQLVGEVAAKIRNFRKPEPYKGKGIRYKDEEVKRKAGKVAKATTA